MTDEQAIRKLLARWAHTFDDRDAAAWTDLFVEHGRFAVDAPAREHVGRASIRSYVDNNIASSPPGRVVKHMCASPVIRMTSDSSAEADVDFVVFAALGDGPWTISSVGRYRNKLVLEDGQWYFLENVVTH